MRLVLILGLGVLFAATSLLSYIIGYRHGTAAGFLDAARRVMR